MTKNKGETDRKPNQLEERNETWLLKKGGTQMKHTISKANEQSDRIGK